MFDNKRETKDKYKQKLAKNHMLIGFGKYLGATGATYSKIIECGWNETVKDHTNFYVSGSYKLAVEGKIGAHEIVVTTDGWSDFVFNNDYKLKNLEEVESFIEENNHLPDVPSEKEVMENGIALSKWMPNFYKK